LTFPTFAKRACFQRPLQQQSASGTDLRIPVPSCALRSVPRPSAHFSSVESTEFVHRVDSLFLGLDNEPGYTILDDWHGTGAVGDRGRSARHGFNHDQIKRLWPIDWEQQGGSLSEKCLLSGMGMTLFMGGTSMFRVA
jgi:hypothetical protein